jgi:hypothetical protein
LHSPSEQSRKSVVPADAVRSSGTHVPSAGAAPRRCAT